MAISLAACGGPSPEEVLGSSESTPYPVPRDINGDGLITVGVTMPSVENSWRARGLESFKEYFTPANGYNLIIFEPVIAAEPQRQQIRDMIAQRVEVIIFAPVYHDNWEPIMQVALNAGIPVIVIERPLDVPEDLYFTYFTNDLRAEGDRVVDWLAKAIEAGAVSGAVNIAHLQGTLGAPEQLARSAALTEAAAAKGWNLAFQRNCLFARYTAKSALFPFLQQGQDLNVIYAENIEMALGAIDAIKGAGLDPADYLIGTFDGTTEGVQLVIDGEIDVIAESTPYYAPQLGELIKRSMAGQVIPKRTYAAEGIIDATNAADMLETAY